MDFEDSSNHPPDDPNLDKIPGPKELEKPRFQIQLPLAAKIALLVGVIALASIGYLRSSVWQNPESSKTSSAALDQEEIDRRKPVGDFELTDAEGKKTPFSKYKGKVVILSFWASWCTPCLVELPTFAEIRDKFEDRGLEVVPVNVDEVDIGVNFTREFWNKRKFKFPSYFDAAKELAGKFDVDMLPANFVIDRHSRIVFSGYGATDWSNEETTEILENLLEEP